MTKKILGYLELPLCFVNKMAVGGGGRPCLKDCEKRVMEVGGRGGGRESEAAFQGTVRLHVGKV